LAGLHAQGLHQLVWQLQLVASHHNFFSKTGAARAQVPLPEPAVQLAAGGFMSFALSAGGRLFAWGSNVNGEKGVGEWGWSGPAPAAIDHLSDGRVTSVRALRQVPQRPAMP
jgi:alpha-tubulin suppressor-like RCC1 family protein